MLVVVKDHTEVGRDKWSDFVKCHPDGNIFQTPEMFELYRSDEKDDAVFLSVLNSGKEILGILIAYIHREYKSIVGNISSRAIVWGGPLVVGQDKEIAGLLLSEFCKICRMKTIYSQFRNIYDVSCYKDVFENKGFKFESHLNFLFDLKKGEENLWSRINSTRRKQINRSTRRGVKTEVTDHISQEDLSSCFSILRLVYKTAKLPHPDIEFFKRAIVILGSCDYFKAIVATLNGEIIGFRFFLSYKRLLYDWYAGSMPDHHDKYVNDLLPWELMKWGIPNGFDTFDFGGAGKPDIPYGVRDFKQKFGGDLVNFGRFEKINKPFLMKMANTGFKFWKLFR